VTSQSRIDDSIREVHEESQAELREKVSASGEKTGVLVGSIHLSQLLRGF
jgi:hypothetical protein